ncbi:tetratricopeptide repeat protein [Streptomyces sp. NPDC049687]|uniref:tetratricopeptide repeat protein n=1 Tax=Streptomyces sp. NPDC049687 TaxID=3365596 RepID=UPI0037BDD9F1
MGDGDYFDFRGGVFHGPVTGVERGSPSDAVSNLLGTPALFTGRDEESERLLAALDPAGRVRVAAVAGLGGVGKTALALHVAHTARERGWFPGGALFVDMRGYDEVPSTSDHAVLSLLCALGGGEGREEDPYGRYRAELARRAPVLIVLDNVSDPARVAPVLPGEGNGHRVLITSREVQDALPLRQFTIGVLETEDACRLVDRSLREHDPEDRRAAEEPEAVRELVDLCGRLPLALLIAAALLRRRRPRPVTTLTAELREAADRVRALRFKGVDQYRRELALRPVFDVMYGRLEPETARVLRAFGQAPTPEVWMGSAVVLASMPIEELRPLLDDLVAASLLTADPGGELWRMHDLVQVYVRGVAAGDPQATEEARTARRHLLDVAETGLRAANNCLRPGSHPDAPDAFMGDYRRALNWLDAERRTLLGLAGWMDCDDPVTATTAMALGLNLDAYLHLRRAFHDWLEVARSAHRTARRLGDTVALAAACQSLGVCLNRLGRHEEGVPFLYRATELWAETENRRSEAGTWANLGAVLRQLGRHAEALEAHHRSLDLYSALGDRGSLGSVLGNYAIVLYALARYDDALRANATALSIHLELGNRSGEAGAYCFLGHLCMVAGRTAQAADEYLRSARLYLELDDPHSAATACLHMGHALRTLGRHAQADHILGIAAQLFTSAGAEEEAAEAGRPAEEA